MFRNFIIVLLAFALGAIVTYIVVVGGVVLAWDLMRVHDQDGGGAMALGLVIGPICAVIGGLVSGGVALLWRTQRAQDAPPETAAERRRDRSRLLVLCAAAIGGFAGRKLAFFLFWFVWPESIDSFWKVQFISWFPTALTALGALCAGYLAYRLAQTSSAADAQVE